MKMYPVKIPEYAPVEWHPMNTYVRLYYFYFVILKITKCCIKKKKLHCDNFYIKITIRGPFYTS